MDEETQKKYDEAIANAEEAKATAERTATELDEEKQGREEDKTNYEKTVAEKDAVIEQKKQDVIGARKKYKKLSDMSAEEKEALTEKEFELQKRQEEQDERQDTFEKEQKNNADKEITARRNVEISKFAGEDKELAEKILKNYERIKDADNSSTLEEIKSLTEEAFNMLGVPKADGVESVIGSGGSGTSGETKTEDFSETEKGKNLADALGLNQTKTKEGE